MAGEDDKDDTSFERAAVKRKNKRLYIGNIPAHVDRESLIVFIQKNSSCPVGDVQLEKTHAFVTCLGNHDKLIADMNKKDWNGKKIVVQLERKKKKNIISSNKPSLSSSWSAPRKGPPVQAPPKSWDEVNSRVEALVQEEIESSGDPVTTSIAATLAVTLVAGNDAFVLDTEDTQNSQPPEESNFARTSQQPLSDLLAEYGEQDVDWMKQNIPLDKTDSKQSEQSDNSCLAQKGKAPIHIEFFSFGYHHGAPKELRKGWSYSQPLSPFDTREAFREVPHYLSWQDGLSGAVKRAIMNNSGREFSTNMAKEVYTTLIEAIHDGGHGYALPLQMVIYVGSDLGRHRSVVACEAGATALRKLLRENAGNRINQPCSVGTKHRDIDKRDKSRISKQHNDSEVEL